MALELTLPLAVEKVLFRLALIEGGRVPIVRAFVELPLPLEDLEHHADLAVDGRTLLKDDWSDFLAYELPEVKNQPGGVPAFSDDCPTCGAPRPAAPSPPEAAPAPPRPVLCDECYVKLRRAARVRDASALDRVKALWKSEDPPEKVAQVEHEILHVAMRLGGSITHTAIAAQTLLAAAAVKDVLDRFAARRYVTVGVLPSGDALVYNLPTGVVYPEPFYKRFRESAHAAETAGGGGLLRRSKPPLEVKAKPAEKPGELKIVVKDKRQRPPRSS